MDATGGNGAARLAHVVDDEPAFRASAARALEEAGICAEEHRSGDAFLRAADSRDGLAFGCVLLDLRMPGTDGLGVLRGMAARGIALPTVLVTAHASVSVAVEAMRAGAVDLVEKPCRPDALVAAAEAALAGPGAARARVARLSPREREVLRGLVEGRQNKEIALALGLSHRTVEIHRANLLRRLGARTLAEAVRVALDAGMRPAAAAGEEGEAET